MDELVSIAPIVGRETMGNLVQSAATETYPPCGEELGHFVISVDLRQH
jgi:hypothetical protein